MEVWRHHRILGNVVVGILVGVFLVLLLANVARTGALVASIRDTQTTNTTLVRDTHHTASLIESCVLRGGECYNRQQRRADDFGVVLNRYVVISASCTAHLTVTGVAGRVSQAKLTDLITACAVKQLARGGTS